MTRILITSDNHLGVNRSGGTTPGSLAALREYTHGEHRKVLDLANDGDTIVINGDWTDTYSIPLHEALTIFTDVCEVLDRKVRCRLVVLPGNHDIPKSSEYLGTVQFLAALLGNRYPDRFTFIHGGGWVDEAEGVYGISHVRNQDLFNLELSRVPDGVKFLLLHCNFNNKFAAEQKHSLDLSQDQAYALKDRGITMILGHEHQQRSLLGGYVAIVGSPWSTSIADCLGNDSKRCAVIDSGALSFIQTWSIDEVEGWYRELQWDEPFDLPAGRGFVRVAGKASAAQASDALKKISRLRQDSPVFVISNAVKIERADGEEELEISVEDIQKVDVLELLLAELNEAQQAVVRAKLLPEVVS